ncbi:MAG: prolyl-tRNA synthetase [Frankiaceae bacterium]|nr:prolyl-tRNA synthetase [Frankiaceae bacterium]
MSKKGNEHAVTPQSEDFSAWYNELVVRAELADRGPAKGTMVIRPYGYAIWELLQKELDTRIKATGHQNAYFPLFIPESYLTREADHVEGFAPELAVVTHAGGKKLEEALVVRPTSETIIGEMFSKWISSYRDLPLLINQWANVVRWELRPRLFLRTTEFLWHEVHTAHADEADAMRETMVGLATYVDVATNIAAMPVVSGEKTAGERFAGADKTFSIEGMMRDGRALQAGTSHYLGTSFAKAFDIQYADETGGRTLCHTASWGMSTRMIGGIIMTHGDDKGLVLPPRLAPYQVVIVPLGKAELLETTTAAAQQVAAELRAVGVRVHVDLRVNLSPGFKYNDWEMKGVPVRLEIGGRDLEAGVATMALRISEDGKLAVPLAELVAKIPVVLEDFQEFLLARATAFREEHTTPVDDWEAFVEAVTTGWALVLHCGRPECEDDIKEVTKATPRNVPLGGKAETGTCVRCGQPSAYGQRIIFGRAY